VTRIFVRRFYHNGNQSRLVLLPCARRCGKETCKRFFVPFAAFLPIEISSFTDAA
jgi:hypothetical protein